MRPSIMRFFIDGGATGEHRNPNALLTPPSPPGEFFEPINPDPGALDSIIPRPG